MMRIVVGKGQTVCKRPTDNLRSSRECPLSCAGSQPSPN